MAKVKSIAVVGAGLGGLSAAIRLAYSGFRVKVFEKNDKPGGKAFEFEKDGFRFDMGPSILTMPFVLEDLFNSVGADINRYLSLEPLNINCKYFYSDGTIIDAFADTDTFADTIEANTGDSAYKVKKYLNYSERIYDLTAELFLFKSFTKPSTFLNFKALKTLLNIFGIDPFRTMHSANASFFQDERTIQLFDRYATFNGSNPYKAPATLNIIQHVECNMGGFISPQGIYSIPKALHKLALSMGVEFCFNCDVKKILVEEKRACGVAYLRREKYEVVENFDVIISNADVKFTYQKLLPDASAKSGRRYSSLEPSSSALVYFWGVEGNHDQLETHNILFSSDYESEFIQLFDDRVCPSDPTVYIYISSKFNPDDAPAGHENWYVMINAPYDSGQNWKDEISKSRERIIAKINSVLGIDIESKILFGYSISPPELEKMTGSSNGSLYGVSSNNKTAAFLRQQNKSKEYKGLYFCGGSAHPGGGIPLVILSGKIASELVEKYES
jgi:phytoene desaturase